MMSTYEKPNEPVQITQSQIGQSGIETDQELLSKFLIYRDRAAIERLILRHSPMVGSVCRATAPSPMDAEDAFQATFLLLLQSAHKIRNQPSLAAWLHGVAFRVASRTRDRNRRAAKLARLAEGIQSAHFVTPSTEDPLLMLAQKIELEWMLRELDKLPEKLKSVLVEHYLLGQSSREISDRMQISVSAVEGRLRRGRKQLRSRLMRYGLSLTVAVNALDLLKGQLLAAEVKQWSTKFIITYLADINAYVRGAALQGASPDIKTLVRGEIIMLRKAVLLKLAAGIMFIGFTGGLVAWGFDSNDQDSSSQASNSVLTIHAPVGSEETLSDEQTIPVTLSQVDNEFDPLAEQVAQQAPAVQANTSNATTATIGTTTASRVIPWNRPEGDAPRWFQENTFEQAIEAKIQENREALYVAVSDLSLHDTPLSQALALLSDECKVSIYLNKAELEVEGVDPDSPITFELPECSLRELLDNILLPLNLSYRVRESGIEITSLADLEANGTLRGYDLSYISSNSENAEAILNTLQASIAPDHWQDNGGTSTISMVGSMLMVVCPDREHFKIEELLRMIGRMSPNNLTPQVNIKAQALKPLGMGGMGSYMGGMGEANDGSAASESR